MSMFSLPDMYGMHFGQKLQPIEESVVRSIEVRMLEESFDEDDFHCQIKHADPSRCSVEVTHQLFHCQGRLLICGAGAARKRFELESGMCGRCLKKTAECWRIEPFG